MAELQFKQYRANSIADFYRSSGGDLKSTVDHLKKQSVSHMTIRRVVKRIVETGSTDFKPITGRPKSPLVKSATKKIDKTLTRDPVRSGRDLARQNNISEKSVRRIKSELGFKSFKAQPAPKLIKDQAQRIVSGATKIYKKLVPSGGNKILVIDDETYVPVDPTQVPGQHFYSQRQNQLVPDEAKFKFKTKFFKKFLVWQAMDQEGNVSEPYIDTGTIMLKFI